MPAPLPGQNTTNGSVEHQQYPGGYRLSLETGNCKPTHFVRARGGLRSGRIESGGDGCRRHTSWGKLRTAVYSATATRSMVKAAVSLWGRTRVASRPPRRLPTTAARVNTPISSQSKWTPWPIRDSSAEVLLLAITSSEVPTTTGIVNPSASTSAGTTTKPPPTPKNPVNSPTAEAVTTTFRTRGQSQTYVGRSCRTGRHGEPVSTSPAVMARS